MQIVDETSGIDGIDATCAALGVCRASYYRSRQTPVYGPRRQMRCPRSLLPEERREVLALFHEDRFADLAPAQSTPRCSTRDATSARSARCTAC